MIGRRFSIVWSAFAGRLQVGAPVLLLAEIRPNHRPEHRLRLPLSGAVGEPPQRAPLDRPFRFFAGQQHGGLAEGRLVAGDEYCAGVASAAVGPGERGKRHIRFSVSMSAMLNRKPALDDNQCSLERSLVSVFREAGFRTYRLVGVGDKAVHGYCNDYDFRAAARWWSSAKYARELPEKISLPQDSAVIVETARDDHQFGVVGAIHQTVGVIDSSRPIAGEVSA